jgi:ATP-dependent RNA helicase DDX24/MAK5
LDYISKSQSIDITALILTPTRELAIQVVQHLKNAAQLITLDSCTSIAGQDRNLAQHVNVSHKIIALVGGISLDKQTRQVSKNPFVIVATPGRLFSIIQENPDFALRLANIKFLVIDEADRMLEQGHFEDLDKILGRLAPAKISKRQTFVYSATMLKDAINRNLLKRKRSTNVLQNVVNRIDFYDKEPIYINLSNEKLTAAGIFEAKIDCLLDEKDIYLYHLLILYKCKTIVFANSIDAIRRLASVLKTVQVDCYCLHAEMQQKQRLKNLERFAASSQSCLIASDVASRGLDIPKVDLIVHYQLPRSADIYVHRAGRTGRAQQKGTSIMLCSPEEKSLYKKVMHMLKNGF